MSTNPRIFQAVLSVLGKGCSSLSDRISCVRVCRSRMISAAVEEWAATGRKVFVSRRVPQQGVDMLKSAGCVVTQWDSDAPVPRDELVKGVHDCDALFCLLTDRIDKQILDAAGSQLLPFWVYTILQPAGRFCGQAAAANSRTQAKTQPAACLLKCNRQLQLKIHATSMIDRFPLHKNHSFCFFLLLLVSLCEGPCIHTKDD